MPLIPVNPHGVLPMEGVLGTKTTNLGQREGYRPKETLQPLDILLIEDNPGDASLIRQVLAKSGMNVKVHLAVDGQQALQMLKEPDFEPSLIILDLNIPKIPGLSLLQRWFFRTPAVVFSSTTNEHEKQRALALGARDFVSKPPDLGSSRSLSVAWYPSGLCPTPPEVLGTTSVSWPHEGRLLAPNV
jgi:two-component system response regulator